MSIDKKQIIKYYDDCDIDYKLIWGLKKNLAIHFGYWDDKTKSFYEALQRENEVLAEKSKISNTDIVLDAGCGVGGSAIFLAKKFECKVVGISISQKQIEAAVKNSKKAGTEKRTEFLNMDFTQTTFEDNSFTVVWAIESVCHTDDKKRFIKEAYRVLKEGGRLIVADGFSTKKEYTQPQKYLIQSWLNGWGVNSLETNQNFERYLKETGFKNISYFNITKNILPSSRRLYFYSFPAFFFGKIAEFLKIRNKIQTGNTWT